MEEEGDYEQDYGYEEEEDNNVTAEGLLDSHLVLF